VYQSAGLAYAVATLVNVATVLVIVVEAVYTVETVVVEPGVSMMSVPFQLSKASTMKFQLSEG
jgi:hypothetical protein